MGVFQRDESETTTLRAINASGAYDPSNPVSRRGLADLETNQNFWTCVLAELEHLDGNHN